MSVAIAVPHRRPRWHLTIRVVSGAIVVLSTVLVVRAFDLDAFGATLERWDSVLGPATPLVFAAAYVILATLLFPASAFTVAAGALFGFWIGLAVSSAASTATAALAFLIARHLLRRRVEGVARRFPRFRAVDRAIRREGGLIVFLLRLLPGFPFSIGNYLIGVTAVDFRAYVIWTWLGMLPSTIVFVAAGAVGRRSLATLATGSDEGIVGLAVRLLAAVAVAAALVVATIRLKSLLARRLREAQAEIDAEDEHDRRTGAGANDPDAEPDAEPPDLEPTMPPSTPITALFASAALIGLCVILWRLSE